MININELREAIQTFGSQAIDEGDLNELLDRLEAAEKGRDTLCAELAPLRKEADKFGGGIDWIQRALQAEAKIEAMEKQEPAWFIDERGEPKRYHKSKADYCKYGGLDLLYALPGAKGE